MHVFSRFKPRARIFPHRTADRESDDLEWISTLKSKGWFIANKCSIKKQNIEYLFKRNTFFFTKCCNRFFNFLSFIFVISCWILSSIFESIKIVFLSFILKSPVKFFSTQLSFAFYEYHITVFLKVCLTII